MYISCSGVFQIPTFRPVLHLFPQIWKDLCSVLEFYTEIRSDGQLQTSAEILLELREHRQTVKSDSSLLFLFQSI